MARDVDRGVLIIEGALAAGFLARALALAGARLGGLLGPVPRIPIPVGGSRRAALLRARKIDSLSASAAAGLRILAALSVRPHLALLAEVGLRVLALPAALRILLVLSMLGRRMGSLALLA